LGLLWAKHDSFWLFWHLVGAKQAAEDMLGAFFVQSCLSCLGMLWAKHDTFWPFLHVVVPSKQLEYDSWCFLCPVQSYLAVGETLLIVAILVLVGALQASTGNVSKLLGHAAGQT
jgi:hypothetical protein